MGAKKMQIRHNANHVSTTEVQEDQTVFQEEQDSEEVNFLESNGGGEDGGKCNFQG